MKTRFLYDLRIRCVVFFILIALSACSRVPQKELQDAVNPLNSHDYPLAVEKLSRLLEKYPDNAQVNYYLAFTYVKNEDPAQKALQHIDRALSINSRYDAVVGDSTMANFLAGNSDSTDDPYFRLALRELEKIIQLHPGTEISDRIQFHKAHYFLLKRNYERTIRELEKVIAAPPNDTEFDLQSRLEIEKVYLENLDDEKKGREACQYLIAHYPNNKVTAEAIFQLADFAEKKMKLFQERHKSLQDFVNKWKDNKSMGEHVPAAMEQSQKDLKMAEEYKSQAVAGYRKIVAEHRNSDFYSRAEARLSSL